MLTEEAAFDSDEFLRWMNCERPEGKPELTKLPLSVDGLAGAMNDIFQQRVEWWGG